MKGKEKAKVLTDDDTNSEDNYASSKDLNVTSSMSNAESDIDNHIIHNNDYKYDLIMERIAELEAKNTHLQLLLNKKTSETTGQQVINNVKYTKRNLNISDDSNDDTSDDNLKLSKQKEKSRRIKTNHSSDPIIDEREVTIITIY